MKIHERDSVTQSNTFFPLREKSDNNGQTDSGARKPEAYNKQFYLSKPKTENEFQGKSLSRVTLQSIGKLTKWKIDRGEIEMTNRESFYLPCVEPFPGNI